MRTLLWTASTLAMGLLASSDAGATSMVKLDTDQLVAAADTIIHGTVQEVWTEPDARGVVWTRAQIQVSEVFKGAQDLDALVVDSIGGRWAGRSTVIFDSARFSPGEEVILFVEQTDSGYIVPVGMFQGKWTVRQDPYTHGQIVQRMTAPPYREYDHRFLPLPPTDQRVPLADLEARIADSLARGWDGKPIPGTSLEHLRHANAQEVK